MINIVIVYYLLLFTIVNITINIANSFILYDLVTF